MTPARKTTRGHTTYHHTSVLVDNRQTLELMRTIAQEANGWDPHVRIEYDPSAGIHGHSPFVVHLEVKAYRRHNRHRVTRGRTPVEALEIALGHLRMAEAQTGK